MAQGGVEDEQQDGRAKTDQPQPRQLGVERVAVHGFNLGDRFGT